MGKVFVVLLCTLFVCGVCAAYIPASQGVIANNAHGITWMMLIGVCSFVGSWRLVSK
jgi:hypothetical protein